MRIVQPLLLVLVVLLAACAVPTDNSVSSGRSSGASSPAAASASPSAAAETADQAAADDPASRNNKYSAPPEMVIDPGKTYVATIETNKGTMTAELFAEEVPLTVNNFVFLARDDFYDGIRFHRIIKDFMIQTGDPLGQGYGGPGYRFEDEPVTRQYLRGTLAMANSGPDTNGSQFFIVHQDYPLPPNYTIFGQLTDGLDTLDAIADTPTTGAEGSTPTEDVHIVNIEIAEQ